MKTNNHQIIRYQIAYQTGARGPTLHRKITAAIRAAMTASARCRRNGDSQGVRIVACEKYETKTGGWEWVERELNQAECSIYELEVIEHSDRQIRRRRFYS